jgi:hypothetical protein
MLLANGFLRSTTPRRLAVLPGLILAVLAAVILFGPTRAASNADWQVLAVAGHAEWRQGTDGGAWQGLQVNGHLPDGAEIRTGSDGNAVVAKGLDRIEIRPGTSLVVAARQSSKGALEIDQASGSATYTVEKRPAGTFSVHTPYVVAVVKGTKFDVDVGTEATSVSVSEGRVGVSDRRGGDSVDVNPGQRATTSRGAVGVDVEAKAASSAPPAAAPNPNVAPAANADPRANVDANPGANANSDAATRGASASSPGGTKGGNANAGNASGAGNAGGRGNAGDSGSSSGGSKDAGGGSRDGSAGDDSGGRDSGNGKGR